MGNTGTAWVWGGAPIMPVGMATGTGICGHIHMLGTPPWADGYIAVGGNMATPGMAACAGTIVAPGIAACACNMPYGIMGAYAIGGAMW